MASLFHWIIIGQALVVFSFVMIYASGFAGGGVIAGIRLGVLLEIAAIGMRPGFYAVQPIPGKLILYGRHRRPHRDGDRRSNGRRDLQTRIRGVELGRNHLRWSRASGERERLARSVRRHRRNSQR